SNHPARTRQMARIRNTGPRSGIGKATSQSERNVPTRAETRGSDPSAVSLGLNRSKVRPNRRTTKTRAATCAASSIWFSMPWLGSKDIKRELTAVVLNVAKTPKMASKDALAKTSPTLAFRKDFVILGLFLRAPSSGWDGKTNNGFFQRPSKARSKPLLGWQN